MAQLILWDISTGLAVDGAEGSRVEVSVEWYGQYLPRLCMQADKLYVASALTRDGKSEPPENLDDVIST